MTLPRALYTAACRHVGVAPVERGAGAPFGHRQKLADALSTPENRGSWLSRIDNWRNDRYSPRSDDLPGLCAQFGCALRVGADGWELVGEQA